MSTNNEEGFGDGPGIGIGYLRPVNWLGKTDFTGIPSPITSLL